MFLVDDRQPQVAEVDVVLQQLVGADEDVDTALGQFGQHLFLLATAAEARQLRDTHRPVGEAVEEVLVVLLGQQGGRHQHRDLGSGLDRDEGRTHGDLGLAEADIATDHPIHRLVGSQVGQHGGDGGGLVRGFLEREAGGEGRVIGVADLEGVAGAGLAPGIEIEQFGGGVAHLLGGLAPGLVPLVGTELVQRRDLGRGTGVAAQFVQRGHRHVEGVGTGVFQHHELVVLAGHSHVAQAGVAADAVILVHHRRTRRQRLQVMDHPLGVAVRAPAPTLRHPLAVELGLGHQSQVRIAQQ